MQSHRGEWTGTSYEAIAIHLRVKLDSSGLVAIAGVEEDIGNIRDAVLAASAVCTVVPKNIEGTRIMVADGIIAAGADVYPAASGKVTATVQGRRLGKAVIAAAANGDWIEVQPISKDADNLESAGAANALTGATMTITAAMCKRGVVTTSHSGTATVVLPPGFLGAEVTIVKIDANAAAHTIDPDASELIQGGSTFTAMDAQWDSVTLRYTGAVVGWAIIGKSIA